MIHPTQALIDAGLTLADEVGVNDRARGNWYMFNDGSVEVEVGEFLYGLTRLLKPRRALETGTYKGVACAYIAMAMRDNGMGRLTTVERVAGELRAARRLVEALGLAGWAQLLYGESMEYQPDGELDLVLLDTDPQTRFDEFDRFYPHLSPGGFILIHDLHPHLGLTWYRLHGMTHWPFGDFREHEVGRRILSHELQVVPFTTPRGLTLFHKANPGQFTHDGLLAGTLQEKEVWGEAE